MKKEKMTIHIKKEDIRFKPRMGVINTKVVPDKTKYTRKKKHVPKDED